MKTEQLYDQFKKSNGITTDSRNVKAGQIFFALWGANYNGNKFAAEALRNGAAWAVIDDPLLEEERTILVDDCLFELQALALHHRKEMGVPVLAITGTNGKTTTRELLSNMLEKKFKVHSTKGNLNNQIGVPLTILAAPKGTEMMIIELGANHIGEIKTLCRIANPDYGILTNIGRAHIEGFGSDDGVKNAKIELYEHLKKVNGIALYNDKNPLLTELIFKIVNRAVPFSDPAGIELTVKPLPSDRNLIVDVSYNHITYRVSTNLFGSYNVENIKAAVATSLFFGVDIVDIISAIENYKPANNRSQIMVTKSNTLICDSYNANPTSMLMALDSFTSFKADKKLVILGDMLELGDKSEEEHEKILNELKVRNFNNALLVGSVFNKMSLKFGFKTFSDVNGLMKFISNEPVSDTAILIKGSRGIALEKVYDLL